MKREFAFQVVERHVLAHLGLAEFHAQRADHFHFAQAVGGAQFVLRDAVGVSPPGSGRLSKTVTA